MELIPLVAILIPIIAILAVFGTAMLAIYMSYRKRKEMFTLYHQERMAAIEKGIELPPMPEDFFGEEGGARRSSHGTLLTGLIMVSIGLTLYLALHFTTNHLEGHDFALYALIPAGIGAACLIYYFAVGRKLAESLEEERKARQTESRPPKLTV
jgi:hypothetical protein